MTVERALAFALSLTEVGAKEMATIRAQVACLSAYLFYKQMRGWLATWSALAFKEHRFVSHAFRATFWWSRDAHEALRRV